MTGKAKHNALRPKFEVKIGGSWIDATAMRAYGITPTQWWALPRPDRLLMAATIRAERLLEAMQQHDYAEDAKKKSKSKKGN